MDLEELRFDGKDCSDLTQDRGHWKALVNMIINL
jgi:hypothetical protein